MDIHKGQVKCEECRHWVDIEDAQKINVSTWGTSVDNVWATAKVTDQWDHDGEIYFCHLHKKPYDRIVYDYEVPTGETHQTYYRDVPATRVEVDENGLDLKIIGE